MSKEYEISEKDIAKVENYLRLNDPEHASRDMAIVILDHMHTMLDGLSFEDPELLEKVIQDIQNKEKPS